MPSPGCFCSWRLSQQQSRRLPSVGVTGVHTLCLTAACLRSNSDRHIISRYGNVITPEWEGTHPAPCSWGTTIPTSHTGSTWTVIFCRSSTWGSSWGLQRKAQPQFPPRPQSRLQFLVPGGPSLGAAREQEQLWVLLWSVGVSAAQAGGQVASSPHAGELGTAGCLDLRCRRVGRFWKSARPAVSVG